MWTQATVAAVWVMAESWPVKRRRPEPDGGESRLVEDPPAIVSTGERDAPIEAHVQITRDCGLPCPACHVDPTPGGPHVPIATLETRFADLATRGVMRVAVGGGESLRHPELPEVADAAKRQGLTIGLTTSGVGPRHDLRGFDQVHVSLDGLGETFRASRGYDGAEAALATIRRLAGEGVRAGVNIVLDRRTFPHLDHTVAAAVEAGAVDVQLLRLKPVGRGTRDYLERRLTRAQCLEIWPVARALMEQHPGVTFRVDCAMIPFLAVHGLDPERMRQFAFMGCHGGDALLSVDTAGGAHACSFVEEAPGPRWREGVTTGPCAGCDWRGICRGGCHAVARHLTGELFAPDPECPMVATS